MKKKSSKRKPARTESQLEADFLSLVLSFKLPRPLLQHYFHPVRQWRFDFAWPLHKLAAEVQGHDNHFTRPGAANDYAKHNAALLLGWRILYIIDVDIEEPNKNRTISTISTLLGILNEHRKAENWSDTIDRERRNIYQKPD